MGSQLVNVLNISVCVFISPAAKSITATGR